MRGRPRVSQFFLLCGRLMSRDRGVRVHARLGSVRPLCVVALPADEPRGEKICWPSSRTLCVWILH